MDTHVFISLGAAIVPALVLLYFFHKHDRFPEPTGTIMATFFMGVVIVIPVVVVALPVTFVFAETVRGPYEAGLLLAFGTAAIPEEFFKYIVIAGFVRKRAHFDEPMDGLVYGAAASLGFAALENVIYVLQGGMELALIRAFTAVPCHAMLGAIMGYYVGQAHFNPMKPSVAPAMLIPMLLHGLYNFPLITLDMYAAYEMEPGPTEEIVLLWMAPVVLIVGFIWAVRLARRLRRLQLARITGKSPEPPT